MTLARAEPAWWSTEQGIVAKGKEFGIEARGNESWDSFKARITAAIIKSKGGAIPVAGLLSGSRSEAA